MQLYCPSCQSTYAAASRCPRCGDRLVTPAESFSALSERVPPPPDIVRTTPAGRIILGCGLALGLYLGLREWGLAAAPDGEWWSGAVGVGVTLALRLAGAVVGGLMAGSGRSPGMTTGAAVGVTCGGIYLLADGVSGSEVVVVDGLAWAALAVAAALAGSIGGWLWPPPAELPTPDEGGRGSSLARLVEEAGEDRKSRPTRWGRIGLALVLLVAGVGGADYVRVLLKTGSMGLLDLGGPAQAPLVDLQLATMAVFFAGAFAGARTGAGLRHGLIAGFLGGLAVLGLAASGLESVSMVIEGLLWMLDLPTDGSAGGQGMIAVAGAVLVLTAAAGWFGAQLMPVLAPAWMRTKLIPMS
jgi:hypothetical protein